MNELQFHAIAARIDACVIILQEILDEIKGQNEIYNWENEGGFLPAQGDDGRH